MSYYKLFDFNSFDSKFLFIRESVALTEGSHIAEIWYKPDKKAYRPIFKTPRLPVKYSCRKFDSGTYGYCVSDRDRDVDDDIEEFFQLVGKIDKKVCSKFRQVHDKKTKFLSSLSKTRGKDRVLKLKLIKEKREDEPLSTIRDNSGESLCFKDIEYGMYSQQYLCPSIVYFNDESARILWYSHQVIVSKMSHVFMDKCLLEDQPNVSGPPPPPLPPPPPISISVPKQPKVQQSSALSVVKQQDLLSAIKNLRTVNQENEP